MAGGGPALPALGPRLCCVAGPVPQGSIVGDIGSDHGYLPAWLVLTGRCTRAIATDSSTGALEATRKTVRGFGVEGMIDLRLGDGLGVIVPGETSVIVIAGMGGLTTVSILSRGAGVVRSQELLVLQPMTEMAAVRKWALENRLAIASEDLVEESGRFYQVICVDPRKDGTSRGMPDEIEMEIGRGIISMRHPLLERYVRWKIMECESVMRKMSGVVAWSDPRMLKWRDRIKRLEGILEWL